MNSPKPKWSSHGLQDHRRRDPAPDAFFKFTAAPESLYIFTKVVLEPWGRLGSGVTELIAAILLFVPGLVWLGAAFVLGVMGRAIPSYLTLLGIEVHASWPAEVCSHGHASFGEMRPSAWLRPEITTQGIFRDGMRCWSPQLEERINAISAGLPGLFV